MKKIFTLLFASLFSLVLFANNGSRFSISSVSNLKLKVEIDGRRYSMSDNVLTVRDLSTGFHSVKIYRDKKKSGVFGSRQEQIYNSSVYIKDGYHLDITINRFGKALVDERRIDRNADWYDEDDDAYYDRGNNNDRSTNDRNNNNGRGQDNVFERTISNSDFAKVKETLRKEFFETTRVNLAKQIMDRNYFMSSQVREMLQLFSSENNKLDLAKYAFSRTTDKGNYYVVNDVFNFSNNKDELARFIRNQ